MSFLKTFKSELDSYLSKDVILSNGHEFSQYKHVNRIIKFANHIYPTGRKDSKGNYKYWFDIIAPRIDTEIKNIDYDIKDISVDSEAIGDTTKDFIVNGRLTKHLRDTGQSEKINDAIEEYSGWGNVVWKKIKGSFEKVDLRNFYVINQAARTLNDTPVIERHVLTQSQLRAKKGVWDADAVERVIKDLAGREYRIDYENPTPEATEIPYYEIFERNGEISLAELKEAQGDDATTITDKDEQTYVLTKLVVAGLGQGENERGKYVLFADKISKMPYKEAHRGRYNGRWWREGIYELLFDIQIRANEIGNGIARAMRLAMRTWYSSPDLASLAQNVLDDLSDGDIIRGNVTQVSTRIENLDQMIAEWNLLMTQADRLANSLEVAQGVTQPPGTPLGLGAMLNQNVNKLYDYLREKFAIGLREVIQDWILPDLLNDLKAADVVKVTGDAQYYSRMYEMAAEGWYRMNLANLGPHTSDMAMMLKQRIMVDLQRRKSVFVKMVKNMWKEYEPRAMVHISGEASNLGASIATIAQFAGIETDPIRRSALVSMAMSKTGIDVDSLPKSDPSQLQPVSPVGAGRISPEQGVEQTV